MFEACKSVFQSVDVAIMAAAVADYTPKIVESQKIKKLNNEFSLELMKTTDILHYLGSVKKKNQVLVGFALETHNEESFAIDKLKSKNADLIVLNGISSPNVGFNFDTNQVIIFDKTGKKWPFELKQKDLVAKDIVNTLINYSNELH
jgi:phosphopantothenoylcysteine decarboxylase/phosphopantothenate--cysteine ligase